MHRVCNKQIYEIDSMINSVYYGKTVESNNRTNTEFNFGYEQGTNQSAAMGSSHSSSYSSFKEVSDTQIQFMQSKISSIQVYFDDLKAYFQNHKDELESSGSSGAGAGASTASTVGQTKKSSADL